MVNKRFALGWKLTAVVLFLICAAGAFSCFMGAALMFSTGHGGGTYYSSRSCRMQIETHQQLVANVVYYQLQLEDESLSYLDRMRTTYQLEQIMVQLDRQNTNFRYQLREYDGFRTVAGNLLQGETMDQAVACRWYAAIVISGGEVILQQLDMGDDGSLHTIFFGGMTGGQDSDVYHSSAVPDRTLVLDCGLPELLQVQDVFQEESRYFSREEQALPLMVGGGLGCILVALICLIYLCLAAGRRRGREDVCLNRQDRIWYDVYLVGMALLGLSLIRMLDNGMFRWSSLSEWLLILQTALCAVVPAAGLLLALLLTTVTRCKAGVLWKHTLLAKLVGLILWFFRVLPITWRPVFVFVCYQLFKVMTFGWIGSSSLLLMFGADAVLLLLLCWWLTNFNRLCRAGEALAAGDLEYRVDTGRMPQDLRSHGEDLNNISGGMAAAVQERMKSERFRAELITNVSHDLKTPLTSIINYVDLLKKTDIQDEKAREYLAVLDNKSQRLKKLTEDLVEASKASTGTLPVNREKLGMVQLIGQALGEYEEKLEARRLQVITDLPEGEVYVHADGRHLWRVLDNLLSNCVKYAMEGTRLYLELQRGHGQISLSVKNISREALNVAPEQLMERFVRGDQSRSTEGSGLGLSIARSLTELQGGVFEISVDGDLFKATVTLPQIP